MSKPSNAFSVVIINRVTKFVRAVAMHEVTKRECRSYCRGFNRDGGRYKAVLVKPYK